jgi:hypothetical protein
MESFGGRSIKHCRQETDKITSNAFFARGVRVLYQQARKSSCEVDLIPYTRFEFARSRS